MSIKSNIVLVVSILVIAGYIVMSFFIMSYRLKISNLEKDIVVKENSIKDLMKGIAEMDKSLSAANTLIEQCNESRESLRSSCEETINHYINNADIGMSIEQEFSKKPDKKETKEPILTPNNTTCKDTKDRVKLYNKIYKNSKFYNK